MKNIYRLISLKDNTVLSESVSYVCILRASKYCEKMETPYKIIDPYGCTVKKHEPVIL